MFTSINENLEKGVIAPFFIDDCYFTCNPTALTFVKPGESSGETPAGKSPAGKSLSDSPVSPLLPLHSFTGCPLTHVCRSMELTLALGSSSRTASQVRSSVHGSVRRRSA